MQTYSKVQQLGIVLFKKAVYSRGRIYRARTVIYYLLSESLRYFECFFTKYRKRSIMCKNTIQTFLEQFELSGAFLLRRKQNFFLNCPRNCAGFILMPYLKAFSYDTDATIKINLRGSCNNWIYYICLTINKNQNTVHIHV